MTGIKFSPQVLSSRENLVNFFEANKAVDKKRILNPPGKWERVAQYIKDSCLRYCRAYTPRLIHKFTLRDIICETDLDKDSVARTSFYELLIYPFERNDVLVRTANYQRVDTDDIYMQKPFPLSGIRDQ